MSELLQTYIDKYKRIHAGEDQFLVENSATPITGGSLLFDGSEFAKYLIVRLKRILFHKRKTIRLLDYGCGKGLHAPQVFSNCRPYLQQMYLYDPCVDPYTKKPDCKFNIIGSADVMEHIPEDCVDEVLDDIYSFLEPNGIALFAISGSPAIKSFIDGENFHVTVKPLEWWKEKLSKYNHYTEIIYHIRRETSSINKVHEELYDTALD